MASPAYITDRVAYRAALHALRLAETAGEPVALAAAVTAFETARDDVAVTEANEG